jgi:WD40 repeat protein
MLEGHTDTIDCATFSPDGSRIATGSRDHTAMVWDARTGRYLTNLIGHRDRILSLAFSPDGRQIATASWDKTARVWDVRTGCELFTLSGQGARMIYVNFSEDGRQITTGSEDNSIQRWLAASPSQVAAWQKEERAAESHMADVDGNAKNRSLR